MDAPVAEKKMEYEAETGVCRSTNESQLSEFPSNEQLEEVGKCSSVGSVAQKKAYFESQYKIIASQNHEKVDKVKKKVTRTRDTMVMEVQTQRDWLGDSNVAAPGLNVDKSNGQNCAIAVELESEMQKSGCKERFSEVVGYKDIVDEIEVHRPGCQISSSETFEINNVADEMKETIDPLPVIEHVKDESCFIPGTSELCNSEEVEELPQNKAGIRASETKQEREKVKAEKSLKSQGPTSAKREVSMSVAKKTPTSSIPKSSATPSPNVSRPTLSKSITPTPKALPKKEHSKSPLTSKKLNSVESRRVTPTSLHMSLNLESRDSEGDMSATMRKSLIMEKMGDKDIVKRAFQAFRNQLSSSESSKPSAENEISGKPVNAKTSSLGTPQKKTERGNMLVKKLSPLSSQTGLAKPTNITRRQNTVGFDLRANRSHDMAHERNKVSKRVEDKGHGKAAERTQPHSKGKKEAEMKRQKPKQPQELVHKQELFT